MYLKKKKREGAESFCMVLTVCFSLCGNVFFTSSEKFCFIKQQSSEAYTMSMGCNTP